MKQKQSKDLGEEGHGVPPLPVRAILCGASGEGKTTLLEHLITSVYRGCFDMVFIWSPSIHVDPAYNKIKRYCEKLNEGKVDEWTVDSYRAEDLEQIITEQTALIRVMKDEKRSRAYSCCVLIDDFADSPEVSRNSKLLHGLFARGRHPFISTFVLTQRWRSLAPIIRLSASCVFVHRLRNSKDVEAIVEELSGNRSRDVLRAAYTEAIEDAPYSYLLMDLMAPPSERLLVRLGGRYIR